MNLNALNTGLTQAPLPTATEASPSMAGLQRAPVGTLSGEDFAAFLRNQINALKNKERQDLAAAPVPPAPPRPERLTPFRPVREVTEQVERDQTKPVIAEKPLPASPSHTNSPQSAASAVEDGLEPSAIDRSQPARTEPGARDQAVATEAGTVQSDADMVTPEPGSAPEAATAPFAELTTIPLSASINIITTAQSQPDDQSVADFALAMGLDPSQVQALFGQTATTSPTNPPSTQQVLAMNKLPSLDAEVLPPTTTAIQQNLSADKSSLNAPVVTADFQALIKASDAELADPEAQTALNNLSIQMATAQATQTSNNAMPISTLAVLSMMDIELRPEDIEALKLQFDALASDDAGLSGLGEHGPSSPTSPAHVSNKAATVLANQPNMAQTFDKLSEKLATELASRMNDQLNAGEWKMKFALKPASLGLVDVQLEMRDGRLTAQFNADTALTQDLIQNGSQRLKEALGQLGMNNASVLVGQGQTQQQGQSGQSGMPARPHDNRVKLADDAAPELTTSTRPRHSNSLQFDHYA